MRHHICALLFFIYLGYAFAFEVDKKYQSRSDDGIYKLASPLPYILLIGTATIALTEGNKTKFGSTAWKATDAAITGAVASKTIAYGIGRQRPEKSNSSHKWFSYGGGDSFPSGHVTTVTAIVTPYVLNYQEKHPEVWVLAVLPVFEAIGRVKANKHWHSDTIAGMGLGALSGYLANNRKIPLILQYIPNGEKIYIGYNFKF